MPNIPFCRTIADIQADVLYDPYWVAKLVTESSQTQSSSMDKLFSKRLQAAGSYAATHSNSVDDKDPFKPYSVFTVNRQQAPILTISPQRIANVDRMSRSHVCHDACGCKRELVSRMGFHIRRHSQPVLEPIISECI